MTGITQKKLTVIITAGAESQYNPNPITFGPNKQNTITLQGYAVSTTITLAGSLSMPEAEISVYGMSLADMNAISSLGQPRFALNKNRVSLLAGDDVSGMSLAFQGNINTAFPNFEAGADVSLDITAMQGI